MRTLPNAPTEYIDLDNVKVHLRVDHSDEDTLIELLLGSALLQVSNDINREIYPAGTTPDTDTYPDAIEITYSLVVAALLLVANWYENREASSESVHTNVPLAYTELMQRHRVIQSGFL